MHPRIARSIALALMGITVLAPGIASADPSVSVAINGTPFTDGSSGVNGQPIRVVGQGCTNPAGEAYMGLFLGSTDPALSQSYHPFETVAVDGGFTLDDTINLDLIGTTYVRFYCSTSPVTAIDDASMLWVSPMSSIVIEQQSGLQAMKARSVSVNASSLLNAATDGDRQLAIATDPDALPYVDRVGITGENAAALKAKVDARVEKPSATQRLSSAVHGGTSASRHGNIWSRLSSAKAARSNSSRGPVSPARPAAPMTHGEAVRYVTAAFQVVGGRTPSSATVQTYAARLEAGAYRVQVVEDIALTSHNAAWWNKHS
ncbi:MAG: hypothetical protein JWO77_3616 [Ilumatobacteraceae bacterium]|nr:hypothetical protein [Ilumatobacteraceae bacterium]